MSSRIKRVTSLILAAVFILSLSTIAAAEGTATSAGTGQSDIVVTGYRVLRGGNPVTRLVKGDTASIELTIKNTALKTSELDLSFPLDLSRVVDSFSTGTQPTAKVTSTGDSALEMKLTFPDCVYSGSGRTFRFMLGERKIGEEAAVYTQGEVTIYECEEYVAPQPTATPAPSAIPAPYLRISRSDVPALNAGDEVTIVLSFTNMGNVNMENALVTISTSEALLLLENASSFPIGNLPAGRVASIPMRFRVAKAVSAEQQTISVEAKFNYFNGEASVQGTASDKLNLLARTTTPDANRPDGPQPNIILQKYTFGDGSGLIAAGSEFDLALDFMNTSSKHKAENVVMTIEPGEGLSLSNSSNTFYYAAIGKEEAKSEKVKLLALPSAKPGVAEVTLTFKYEYVDNNKRSPVTITQKLSIQIFQPDRFDVTLNPLPASVTVGNETTVSLNYMNKGKSDVSNVQAKLTVNVPALGSVQNIGNLEPGKSGSINFVLTPDAAGTVNATVTLTYEDASGKLQTKEIPISLTVDEPAYDPATDGDVVEIEETPKSSGLIWYILGGVALLGGGTVLTVKKIKSSKKKSARKSTFEWKDDAEG